MSAETLTALAPDAYARRVVFERLEHYRYASGVLLQRVQHVAGLYARRYDAWYVLDQCAWAHCDVGRVQLVEAAVCGGLDPHSKRILRELLDLRDEFADVTHYAASMLVLSSGSVLPCYVPRARLHEVSMHVAQQGGHVAHWDRRRRDFVPRLVGLAGGAA